MTVSFPKPIDLGEREWGSETLFAYLRNKFSGKVLRMKAGAMGGLQYHREKYEFAYLLEGSLLLRYDEGNGHLTNRMLVPGDCIEIPPGSVHQEEAVADCIILEVSTPVFNDRVRVETQYGLPEEGGLPTTQQGEIRYEP